MKIQSAQLALFRKKYAVHGVQHESCYILCARVDSPRRTLNVGQRSAQRVKEMAVGERSIEPWTMFSQSTFSAETFYPSVTKWKMWLRRFESTMTIFHVRQDKKVAYLLHYIGAGAFNMVSSKLWPIDPYKQKYTDLAAKLEDYNA